MYFIYGWGYGAVSGAMGLPYGEAMGGAVGSGAAPPIAPPTRGQPLPWARSPIHCPIPQPHPFTAHPEGGAAPAIFICFINLKEVC